ncbi:MAG TPA: NADH-quinone oxidoreductase subunit C [Geobacteraceae bacterium]|nr:NADH-quinone oxidoreductase subunit C [Geobacteraceae bacterium]
MAQLIEELRGLPAQVNEVDYRKRGYHIEVLLTAGEVRRFAGILRDRRFYLVFVSAVHLAPAVEVIYQFASHSDPCRIIGRAQVTDDGSIPTISDIFDGANWHERETMEMFGVSFSGHPYPEPLLLPEDAAGLHPLLKGEGGVKTAEQVRWQSEGGI